MVSYSKAKEEEELAPRTTEHGDAVNPIHPILGWFNLVTLFGPSGQSIIPQPRIELIGGPNDGELHTYRGSNVIYTTDNVIARYDLKETMKDSVTTTRYVYKVKFFRPHIMSAMVRKAVCVNE